MDCKLLENMLMQRINKKKKIKDYCKCVKPKKMFSSHNDEASSLFFSHNIPNSQESLRNAGKNFNFGLLLNMKDLILSMMYDSCVNKRTTYILLQDYLQIFCTASNTHSPDIAKLYSIICDFHLPPSNF